MSEIGVVYIARGKDPNWKQRVSRFVASYLEHPAGIDHRMYVIYKEFETVDDLAWAIDVLDALNPVHILNHIPNNAYGGGCFQEAANHVIEPLICTLVSTSEIMHDEWLKRLHFAYSLPGIGLVGCTGSRDSGNIHIRDTAILINREVYLGISRQFDFTKDKEGYLNFEHGPNNLTIQMLRNGAGILVVEKERALAPHDWPFTTYRGNLENVLVHDRGARDYHDL